MPEVVEIRGLDRLGRALQQFPQILAAKYLRRAAYTAAALIQADAVARAPERTGELREHIAIFKRRDEPMVAHYAIGVRRIRITRKFKRVLRILRRANGGRNVAIEGDPFYWRFMEFGYHDRAGVFRPGTRFLTKAFESQKLEAIEVFRKSLADGVIAAAQEASA